jgi:hypothetical protein
MDRVAEALAAIKALGAAAEMRAAAQRGLAPADRPGVNTHIHLPPNFSAFQNAAQAVALAREQGVRVLGASQYYPGDTFGEFASATRGAGVFPLFGLEVICILENLARDGVKINDPGNPGKMYLCGRGVTRLVPMSSAAQATLDLIRRFDSDRLARAVDILVAHCLRHGVRTDLTLDSIRQGIVDRCQCRPESVLVQERHVAQALQEAIFDRVPAGRRAAVLREILGDDPSDGTDDVVSVQDDLRWRLMKAGRPTFAGETLITFDQAYRLVLDLGGIPCYPVLADGASPVCGYESPVGGLIDDLRSRRIHAAEFIPVRNEPGVLLEYVLAMRAAGLVVTGGTEHNTSQMLPLVPACKGGAPLPEEVRDIFWEGACVVAAHQFLAVHGECGLVDGQGRPNPAYSDAESRIAAMSRLGAAVIQTALERWGRENG